MPLEQRHLLIAPVSTAYAEDARAAPYGANARQRARRTMALAPLEAAPYVGTPAPTNCHQLAGQRVCSLPIDEDRLACRLMPRVALLDVPLDCSATSRGEERASAALREAGLLHRLDARDAGVVAARVRDTRRDPTTGVIAAEEIRSVSMLIARRVRELLDGGETPLVLGGDCTVLLGVFAGLPDGTGLWFVDGHADFYDGETSPTGEAADMDLAMLTGHTPNLVAGRTRLVDPAAVVLLGHRPDSADPDVAEENARVDPAIAAFTAPELRAQGMSAAAKSAAALLAGRPAWLHIDLDVLDESALSAVTYPQPHGLDWEELVTLARPLATASNLIGVSVADFNPDHDPSGHAAHQVVQALERVLA